MPLRPPVGSERICSALLRKPAPAAQVLLIATVVLLCVLNARALTTSYSFWLDELATVSLFRPSGTGLWAYLMQDNFPPLYFLLLKAWVPVFGLSEVSLRLLSWFCVSAAIGLIGWFVLVAERPGWIWPAFAASLLGTLPTVAFAGQEARPYGLMLLLATLAVTSALAQIKDLASVAPPFLAHSFAVSAFLLSLTHYFGLLLALLLVGANLIFLPRRLWWRQLALAAACLIWPVIHASQGRLLSQAGGHFWIQVAPGIGTLKVLLVTFPFLLLLLPLSVLAWIGDTGSNTTSSFEPAAPRSLRYLALVCSAFLALLLIADLHTPLSIPRYYIALMPVAVLLLIEAAQAVMGSLPHPAWRAGFAVLAGCLILAQAVKAQQRLVLKSAPDQNWKALAVFVRDSDLCRDGCDALGYSEWGAFYFHGLPLSNLDPGASAAFQDHHIHRPLLGFHRAAALIPTLRTANPQALCLQPSQSIPAATFVMADPGQFKASAIRRAGLLPCP